MTEMRIFIIKMSATRQKCLTFYKIIYELSKQGFEAE